MLAAGERIETLGPRIEARAANDPTDAGTLMDLATLLILTQNPENRKVAFAKQWQAIRMRQVYRLRSAPQSSPSLRLLAVMALGDMTANTPVDCLLYGSNVAVSYVYVAPGYPMPPAVPDHDVVFVAVGESEANQAALRELESFVAESARPVVNRPDKIKLMTRTYVAAVLGDIPGVLAPSTERVSRMLLAAVAKRQAEPGEVLGGGRFPIIVRPLDSHAGKGLSKVGDPDELEQYLSSVSGEEFYISNFIDYRSPDGQFRKWRIAVVDGRPFVAHVGISSDWMIHYLNAGMYEDESKRLDEARLMESFRRSFAVTHASALEAIDNRLGLDYWGIDCAETPDGSLLIFEADTAMLVHAFDDPELFPYKLAHMGELFSAFRELLSRRAAIQGGER